MHKFITAFWLGCFITFASTAQQSVIDSLLLQLKSYTKEDTARINLLNNLAYEYCRIDPGKGLRAANMATALAQKLGDDKNLSVAYNYAGLNQSALGEDGLALSMYNRSMIIRNRLKDLKGIADLYHNIGLLYFNSSDYVQALNYQKKSLVLYQQLKDTLKTASALNSLGVDYMYLSNYPTAIQYYLKALSIWEKHDNKEYEGMANDNIGLVYQHMQNPDNALQYHYKALKLYQEAGKTISIVNVYGNIANAYDDKGDSKKALELYRQAYAIAEQINYKRGLASNSINAGIASANIMAYDSALHYLQRGLAINRQLKNEQSIAIALTYIAQCYLKAPMKVLQAYGINTATRYTSAIALQKESLALAKSIDDVSQQSEGWSNMSEIYTAINDNTNALAAYKNFIGLRDSAVNSEKKEEITRNEMQYEFDKKEAVTKATHAKEQALAASEIKRQRVIKNFIITGSAFFLIVAFIIFIFYRRKMQAEQEKKDADFKLQVADTEMKALRAQMNPHFIFNSLNSISDFLSKNNVEKADEYLTKFAKVMRLTLENSEQKEISLAEDLKALELYMQLEGSRLNNNFSYEIKIDESIDVDNTLIPPMILQPFVENSIWHGFAQKKEGKISIRIIKENDMINCIVEDNGAGRNSAHDDMQQSSGEKKSLGMKLTKARIDIINKIKNTSGSVKLTDLKEGLRAEVRLPLEISF